MDYDKTREISREICENLIAVGGVPGEIDKDSGLKIEWDNKRLTSFSDIDKTCVWFTFHTGDKPTAQICITYEACAAMHEMIEKRIKEKYHKETT